MTNLLLLDDCTLLREGLGALIREEPDICVVAQASSIAETASLGVSPDVVVTEVALPDLRGPRVVGALRSRFNAAAILVLTFARHPARVQQVLEEGADGYLLKTASVEEVLRGIRAVASGETYLQPSLGLELARWSGVRAGNGLGHLSPKEERVLRLLALGHTNVEIACAQGVSLRTVETHRAHVLQKLGLSTRAELVDYALTSGLLDAEER